MKIAINKEENKIRYYLRNIKSVQVQNGEYKPENEFNTLYQNTHFLYIDVLSPLLQNWTVTSSKRKAYMLLVTKKDFHRISINVQAHELYYKSDIALKCLSRGMQYTTCKSDMLINYHLNKKKYINHFFKYLSIGNDF